MVGTKECDLVGILMGENELFSFGIRLSLFWTLGNSKHYAKIDHMQKLEPIPKCDMAGMVSIWPILYRCSKWRSANALWGNNDHISNEP